MKDWRKLILAFALLLLAVGLLIFTGPREPEYQGKPLSYWVLKAGESNVTVSGSQLIIHGLVPLEIEHALVAIDTNGIRFYLEWLPYRPSRFKKAQIYVATVSRKWIRHNWSPHGEIIHRSIGSTLALGMLGERGQSAIPTLVNYATNTAISPTPHFRAAAVGCLVRIGEPALPALLGLMTNSSPEIRGTAIDGAARFGTNAAVVEQLQARLDDHDSNVRMRAKRSLQQVKHPP